MKFCEVCDNMMYMTLSDGTRDPDLLTDKDSTATTSTATKKLLVYYCKNCGHRVKARADLNECVVDASYVDDAAHAQQFATTNIMYDPTLPRVDNIKCTNVKCTKPADASNDVIYFKYDHKNLKYMFSCTYCQQFWHQK